MASMLYPCAQYTVLTDADPEQTQNSDRLRRTYGLLARQLARKTTNIASQAWYSFDFRRCDAYMSGSFLAHAAA